MCDYFVDSNSFVLLIDPSVPAASPEHGTTQCTSSAEVDEEVLEQQRDAFFFRMNQLLSEDPTEQLAAVLHYKSVLLIGELHFSSFLCVERLITDFLRIVVLYIIQATSPTSNQ